MLTDLDEIDHDTVKSHNFWRVLLVFFLGVVCFLLTQVFTRVPLLGWLQKQMGFLVWAMSYPLLSGILVALSAGVFEESGRFAFKALALKPAKSPYWEPIVFGLGHGLCESIWLLRPLFGMISLVGPGQFVLPIVERLLAIAMHIGFSVIVWNGFQLDNRWQYLVLAILGHGLVDALIPLAGKLGLGTVELEAVFSGLTLLLVIYTVYSKRYYRKEESYE